MSDDMQMVEVLRDGLEAELWVWPPALCERGRVGFVCIDAATGEERRYVHLSWCTVDALIEVMRQVEEDAVRCGRVDLVGVMRAAVDCLMFDYGSEGGAK